MSLSSADIQWDAPHPDTVTWDAPKKPPATGNPSLGALASDTAAGFSAPFRTLGHEVMQNYRDTTARATQPLPGPVEAAKRAAGDTMSTGRMMADLLNLGSAPVRAVTHPLAHAMEAYGPTPYKATLRGPVPLQGQEARDTIEGALNTALSGARPKGQVLAEALAATPKPPSPMDAPSIADLRGQSGQLYASAKAQGVIVKPQTFQSFATDLRDKLATEGLDEGLQPKAQAVLNRIAGTGNEPIDLTVLDNLRRLSTNATEAAAGNPSDKRLTRLITDHIDDFVGGLKSSDVLAGDAPAASKMLTEARSLWKQQAKGQQIEDLIGKAKLASAGNTNYDGALRSQFQKLARNSRGMARFSPDEQAAILKVASGSPFDQAMFGLGRMAPTNLHTMGAEALVGGLGMETGHPLLGAAPALIGVPAKVISTINTSRNAKLASALMRRGQ